MNRVALESLVLLTTAASVAGCASAQCYFTPAADLAPPEMSCRFVPGDIDTDGDIDFLDFGEHSIFCWRRVTAVSGRGWSRSPVLLVPEPADPPRSGALADLDADGVLDLVLSADREALHLYAVVQSDSVLRCVHEASELEQVQLPSGPLVPHVADLDADGDLDVAFVERNGHLGCVRRASERGTTSWTYAGLLFGVEMGKWNTATGALGDIDHDGDADLVSVNLTGPVLAWENTSTVDEFDFSLEPRLLDVLDEPPHGICGLALVDLDSDSDLDMVLVDTLGVCRSYRNADPCLRHLLDLEPTRARYGESPK